MGSETGDILRFLAFGVVWLFPAALIIAVLGFAHADAKARREDPGPNVVAFPVPDQPEKKHRLNWRNRLKQLAFPGTNR